MDPDIELEQTRPVICVRGLGHVGAAVARAVARATRADGRPLCNVVGIDLPTGEGFTSGAESSAQ